MHHQISKYFLISISFSIFFILSGCNAHNKPACKVIEKNIINEISHDIIQNIAPKYYNFDTKRIIHVQLNNVESNYDEEPLFAEYLFSMVHQKLEEASQIDLTPYSNSTYDAIASIIITKQPANKLKILLICSDSKSQKAFYSNQQIYEILNFNLVEYGNFKKEYGPQKSYKEKELKAESERASITIQAVPQGDSYKADDKYYSVSHYGLWGGSQYIYKHDTGNSGYYPSNLKCIINNKAYSPDVNHVFYSGNIEPGLLDLGFRSLILRYFYFIHPD